MSALGGSGLAARPPAGEWPPACHDCGFVGAPSPEASPYIWCDGHIGRHWRLPVQSTFMGPPQAVYDPVDHPAKVTYPEPRPVPRPAPEPPPYGPARAPSRAVIGRGDCAVCGRGDLTVRPGATGPIITTHGPPRNRCPGSENPPAPGTLTT